MAYLMQLYLAAYFFTHTAFIQLMLPTNLHKYGHGLFAALFLYFYCIVFNMLPFKIVFFLYFIHRFYIIWNSLWTEKTAFHCTGTHISLLTEVNLSSL